jgi:antirestriction protein ArdC
MNDSVYQIITDRIVSLLENGTVPWHQPWNTGNQAPQNLVSKKPYRGINPFLLNSMHYASPYWLSFKQAQELGGNVKKGEKACPVVFWKWLDGQDKETGEKKKIPLLRYYSVFNVNQCEGIDAPTIEGATREHSPVQAAESIVAAMPKRPEIKHGLDRAFYSPALDYVGMPNPEQFKSAEDYYSVVFHELTHSTGAESRLNRKGVASGNQSFGSESYSKEELIAEFGAAFLCGTVGIVERTIDNSSAYIASWLQRLKNDSKLVVQAAAQAQKAADFILNKHQGETED